MRREKRGVVDLMSDAEGYAEAKGHRLGEWEHETEEIEDEYSPRRATMWLGGYARCVGCDLSAQIAPDDEGDDAILFNEGDDQHSRPQTDCPKGGGR